MHAHDLHTGTVQVRMVLDLWHRVEQKLSVLPLVRMTTPTLLAQAMPLYSRGTFSFTFFWLLSVNKNSMFYLCDHSLFFVIATHGTFIG